MLPADEESRLIGSIYDAALEPTLWTSVLAQLRNLGNAKQCNIVFYDQLNRSRSRFFTGGQYSEEHYKKYLDEVIDVDIHTAMSAMAGTSTGVFSAYNRYNLTTYDKDATYLEYLEKDVQEGPLIAAELLRLNYSFCCASLIKDFGDPPFDENVLNTLNRLAPHLARAIQIYHSLSFGHQTNQTLQTIIESAATALLLVDANAKVLLANREATRLVEEHPAIEIHRDGRFRATVQVQDQTLQNAIRETIITVGANTQASHEPVFLPIAHPARAHPLKLTVLKLSANHHFTHALPGASAAILLLDPERHWSIPIDYLREAYELTQAETAIAQELINGACITGLARSRGTTPETTKGQVKKLLSKMNCPSQAALIQLLITLCADFSDLINW